VPGGGLSPDGQRWVSCRSDFFLPVQVLSLLFRRLFLESLRKVFDAGKLNFFATLESLRQPDAFAQFLARMKGYPWVVYAKRPFAGPQQVLDYVGRYTHRVAISNHRLLDIDNGEVSFQWKDYSHGDRLGTMTLKAEEFIRRFLLHVLPDGFQHIRYYGLLANRYRKQNLERCRRLLGMPAAEQPTDPCALEKDYRDRYQELTGRSLYQCPLCGQGRMLVVAILPKYPCHSAPPIDSS
jgi:hypothetical protein